jgi:hypothetical protein
MLDCEDERTTALSEQWGNTRPRTERPMPTDLNFSNATVETSGIEKESVTETSWFQKKYYCNIAYVPQTILNAFVPKHFL